MLRPSRLIRAQIPKANVPFVEIQYPPVDLLYRSSRPIELTLQLLPNCSAFLLAVNSKAPIINELKLPIATHSDIHSAFTSAKFTVTGNLLEKNI